jgi:molybdenum cofactor cytidylyltransferase
MPFVKPHQIDCLIDEFTRASDNVIVVPVFDNRPGNPRLWARSYFEAMCGCDGDVGARHLLKKFSTMVRRVAMNDTKVLTDIDTPAELAQYTENLAKEGSI